MPAAAAAPPVSTVTTPALRLTLIPAPATTASVSSSESIQSWNSPRACSAVIRWSDANTLSMAVRKSAFVTIAMSCPIHGIPVRRHPIHPNADRARQ